MIFRFDQQVHNLQKESNITENFKFIESPTLENAAFSEYKFNQPSSVVIKSEPFECIEYNCTPNYHVSHPDDWFEGTVKQQSQDIFSDFDSFELSPMDEILLNSEPIAIPHYDVISTSKPTTENYYTNFWNDKCKNFSNTAPREKLMSFTELKAHLRKLRELETPQVEQNKSSILADHAIIPKIESLTSETDEFADPHSSQFDKTIKNSEYDEDEEVDDLMNWEKESDQDEVESLETRSEEMDASAQKSVSTEDISLEMNPTPKSKSSLKYLFKCPNCGRGYHTSWGLTEHIDSKCGAFKQFQCNLCEKRFQKKSNMVVHIKRQHTTNNHSTGEFLPSIDSFESRHQVINSSECANNKTEQEEIKKTELQCELCSRKFTQELSLKRHLKSYHDTDNSQFNFTCNECDRQFRTRSTLSKHTATKCGTKKHVCTVCERGFVDKRSLIRHMWKIHEQAFTSVSKPSPTE